MVLRNTHVKFFAGLVAIPDYKATQKGQNNSYCGMIQPNKPWSGATGFRHVDCAGILHCEHVERLDRQGEDDGDVSEGTKEDGISDIAFCADEMRRYRAQVRRNF